MPDVLMVIAPNVFRDEEYAQPKRVLETRGAHVVTASTAPGKCIGKLGMVAEADISIADALSQQWDAAVFIGGGGAKVFFDDPVAQQIARSTAGVGGVIGSICIASSVLARAGLLRGARATAFASQREDLLRHGAEWDDGPVVIDGRIITANGPDAAEAFGLGIATLLGI